MRNYELSLENTRSREATCFMIALGIHGLAVFWNPVMLKSGFQAPHDFVQVDMIEQAPVGAQLPEEKPKKMSLMDTLKDMLMKPKSDELAHVAPSAAPVRTAPAPSQPLLKDVTRPRMITPGFIPQAPSDEIAGAKGPDAIKADTNRIAAMPLGTPTLKTKAFGGIRAKDLPFQVGTEEAIAGGGAGSIPIALGNKAAKGALSYAAPALHDASKSRMGIQTLTDRVGGGIHGDTVGLGAGTPAPISLSGTGGSGTAPSGSTAPSLQQRRGGGGGSLVGAALLGQRGGSYMGGGSAALEAIPSAARELENQISQAGSPSKAAKKLTKSFELAGPLNNRPIIHKVIPQYPDWAQEQGVIGSVRLYFTVTSEGKVRPNIQVTKTTGYPQLDQLAIDALKQWQFATVGSDEEARGEWGIITFNFSLSS